MHIFQVKDNTWAIDGPTCLVPFYRLAGEGIILLDSGDTGEEAQALAALLEGEGLRPLWILNTHSHYDHTGGNALLQQKYGTQIASPLVEAASAASPRHFRFNYDTFTPGECDRYFADYCYTIGRVVLPGEQSLELGGAVFEVLPTPGHTPGHTAYITPDGVAYLGDALLSADILGSFKMPTGADRALEQRTKAALAGLRCDFYILAHKEVRREIAELARLNIDETQALFGRVYDVLQDGMGGEEWARASHGALDVRSKSERPNAIFERNHGTVVDYLVDSGAVRKTREGGVRRYFKMENHEPTTTTN